MSDEMYAALEQALRTQLSKLRSDLNGTLRAVAEESRELNGGVVGDLEGSLGLDPSLEFAIADLKATDMERIEAALWRIKTRQYGKCTLCSNEIKPKRLAALPFATTCVRCAEKHDVQAPRAGFAALDAR